MISGKRILVLAPHTDDGELGCGGAIARLIKSNEIFYAAFSSCKQSVPAGFEEDVLKGEMMAATSILGIRKENVFLFDYEVRRFNHNRQEILDDLLKLKKDLSPDIVFMPSANDIHQDHATINSEGLRAFKFCTLLNYELPWNNLSFNAGCYIALQDEELNIKCKAIAAYKSQMHRSYTNDDFTLSLAKVRGVQSGHQYAEAFEVVRWII
ncbi:MAG: PIG-L family deacetylase [Chitinophagaceae bacterium]|nr:MAG: PIG-L family deacetylase [Chitinophagaceae bacterium]